MGKNGYVNFNFLDSKSNINDILVGLDLDYSNKVIAPDGHELAFDYFHTNWEFINYCTSI